jgi:hypothetical protein
LGQAEGVDGLKLGSWQPDIMKPLLADAKALNMGSTAHLDQAGVAQMNAIDAARLGLGTVTHFYGHFESLLKDYVVQPYPVDQNMNDEYMRFGQWRGCGTRSTSPALPNGRRTCRST